MAFAFELPALGYLAELIAEDEMRHHRLFTEIANAVHSDVEHRPGEPAAAQANQARAAPTADRRDDR